MNTAILAGLASGALWGFAFIVPKILSGCPSSLVAFGRFSFFGAISLVVLVLHWRQLRPVFVRDRIKHAMIFALLGNSLYYFFLVLGIRLAGITASSLLVGLLPVTVAVAGNGGRISRRMAPSLTLIAAGILLINFDLVLKQKAQGIAPGPLFGGIACLLCALALWTWYAVANARFLKRNVGLSGNLWSSMTGVCTLIFSPAIALAQLASEGGGFTAAFQGIESVNTFLFWSAVLGIGASWLALWLWNIASHRLPTSLSGQLIVSETVFALLYGFIVEHRFPEPLELVAIVSMIVGVLLAIRNHGPRAALSTVGTH